MKSVIVCMIILLFPLLSANDISAQPQQAQDRVWFSPNTASVDMLEMFTSPEDWSFARARIDVFKFSVSQVGSGGWGCQLNPAQICGENYLDNLVAVDAFSKLGQWGIGIGIESFFAGPVISMDPVECSTAQNVYNLSLSGSINIIQNVEDNGGVVRYLAMDEPIRQWLPSYYYIYTGQTDPRPCLVDSLEVLADHVSAYILQMEEWFPDIPIGHIELYPEVSIDQFKDWIIALEARGVSLPFLHLDVNGPRVDQYNSWGITTDIAADFTELKTFLDAHGIAFGVIFTDIQWNSRLWEEGTYDDQTYYDGTMDWIDVVESSGVELDHIVIQSWVWPYFSTGAGPKEVPVNLPEDDPSIYSHTRLVNDALAVLTDVAEESSGDRSLNSRLHQNHPNPFSPGTSISYELPKSSRVVLKIYDVRGRELQILVNAIQGPGRHSVDFITNDVPSGVYFYKLQVGGQLIETKKMVLLK